MRRGERGRGRKGIKFELYMLHQHLTEPHLPTKGWPICYAKLLTALDTVWPILGLVSCAGVTRRRGLSDHSNNTNE